MAEAHATGAMLSREEAIKAFGVQQGYTTAFWGPNDM